jgi:hypothetical protein
MISLTTTPKDLLATRSAPGTGHQASMNPFLGRTLASVIEYGLMVIMGVDVSGRCRLRAADPAVHDPGGRDYQRFRH